MGSMRSFVAAATLAGLLALAACGNGEAAGSMADWRERHRDSVAALDRDLMAADAALEQGDRNAILDACNLLDGSLADVRDEALPVPDATANEELTAALSDIGAAAESCLAGARSGAAADVEGAMELVDDALASLAGARAALDISP